MRGPTGEHGPWHLAKWATCPSLERVCRPVWTVSWAGVPQKGPETELSVQVCPRTGHSQASWDAVGPAGRDTWLCLSQLPPCPGVCGRQSQAGRMLSAPTGTVAAEGRGWDAEASARKRPGGPGSGGREGAASGSPPAPKPSACSVGGRWEGARYPRGAAGGRLVAMATEARRAAPPMRCPSNLQRRGWAVTEFGDMQRRGQSGPGGPGKPSPACLTAWVPSPAPQTPCSGTCCLAGWAPARAAPGGPRRGGRGRLCPCQDVAGGAVAPRGVPRGSGGLAVLSGVAPVAVGSLSGWALLELVSVTCTSVTCAFVTLMVAEHVWLPRRHLVSP